MLKPIITVRELKNQHTGIDVQVPSYKGETGLLTTVYKYNIVVVSNLNVFKTADQKSADVVQFMTSRPDEHFIRLRHVLSTKFPHATLPEITKLQNALFADVNPRERKQELERFLKAVVTVKELVTYHLTLEFLGVPPVKAYNFMQIEKGETVPGLTKCEEKESPPSNENEDETEAENLFMSATEDKANDDLFSSGDRDLDDELFPAIDLATKSSSGQAARLSGSSKLFEDQDIGGGVSRSDAPELFLAADKVETATEVAILPDEEDSSDLLKIEDDIDAFLKISTSKKTSINSKPLPNRKPTPSKKPTTTPKPSSHEPNLTAKNPNGAKAVISRKPGLPPKPGTVTSKPVHEPNSTTTFDSDNIFTSGTDPSTLDADDIFKYIQENTAQNDDDVDLFS